MKYLLVLLVVVVAFWIWRNNRRQAAAERQTRAAPRQHKTPLPPTVMVACAHCGTHLPQADALQGPGGVYCCTEHRQLHEARH